QPGRLALGVGVIVAGLLASAFRVSIAAGLLGDLTFKSLFPVFFYFNLVVGDSLLGQRHRHIIFSLEKLMSFKHPDFAVLRLFGKAFLVGALVNTLLFGLLAAGVVYLIFAKYRPYLVRYVFHLKKKG
ncbi:MAG: DUF2062 domain-containing protein, partial [Peptococcaceae bacterium]|nr:DUF2062 domain-containing protein [Peptococcaceae bacterium]